MPQKSYLTYLGSLAKSKLPKLRHNESAKVWLDVLAEGGVLHVWAKAPRESDATRWLTGLSNWLEQQSHAVPEGVAWLGTGWHK